MSDTELLELQSYAECSGPHRVGLKVAAAENLRSHGEPDCRKDVDHPARFVEVFRCKHFVMILEDGDQLTSLGQENDQATRGASSGASRYAQNKVDAHMH